MPTYPLEPIQLRYHGLFDFDGFYSAVIDWAKNYGYLWHEKSYKHKVPSPRGAEQEWDWQMSTNVNEYVRFVIEIEIHSWDLLEVEVEVEGKKKILNNGRMLIKIEGAVELDWQKKFTGSKFRQKLGEWYIKYYFNRELIQYWDPLYYRVWNLHAIMKKYFDMQTKKNAYKNYIGEH